jgi:hypothetical protein
VEMKSLLSGLLQREVPKRLGCQGNGCVVPLWLHCIAAGIIQQFFVLVNPVEYNRMLCTVPLS